METLHLLSVVLITEYQQIQKYSMENYQCEQFINFKLHIALRSTVKLSILKGMRWKSLVSSVPMLQTHICPLED